jgi:hypothetical protein
MSVVHEMVAIYKVDYKFMNPFVAVLLHAGVKSMGDACMHVPDDAVPNDSTSSWCTFI